MAHSPDRLMARLMTLAAVGSEMAAPIAIGLLMDYWLGIMPIFAIVGAVLGLFGGIYHLVILTKPGQS